MLAELTADYIFGLVRTGAIRGSHSVNTVLPSPPAAPPALCRTHPVSSSRLLWPPAAWPKHTQTTHKTRSAITSLLSGALPISTK